MMVRRLLADRGSGEAASASAAAAAALFQA